MYDFHDFTKAYAICIYLESFGYKAQVNSNTIIAYVQDPVDNTFVVLVIPTWEAAREFIKVRTQS